MYQRIELLKLIISERLSERTASFYVRPAWAMTIG
jgi:hypothetical protein